MTQLTKNFALAEFACKDGTSVPVQYLANVQRLANNVQALRDYVGQPIRINSGYRTEAYNRQIDGARYSQHLLAKAADVAVAGLTPAQVYCTIEGLIEMGRMQQGGLGIYTWGVHYDVRDSWSRWIGNGVSTPHCAAIMAEVREKVLEEEEEMALAEEVAALQQQVAALEKRLSDVQKGLAYRFVLVAKNDQIIGQLLAIAGKRFTGETITAEDKALLTKLAES